MILQPQPIMCTLQGGTSAFVFSFTGFGLILFNFQRFNFHKLKAIYFLYVDCLPEMQQCGTTKIQKSSKEIKRTFRAHLELLKQQMSVE